MSNRKLQSTDNVYSGSLHYALIQAYNCLTCRFVPVHSLFCISLHCCACSVRSVDSSCSCIVGSYSQFIAVLVISEFVCIVTLKGTQKMKTTLAWIFICFLKLGKYETNINLTIHLFVITCSTYHKDWSE